MSALRRFIIKNNRSLQIIQVGRDAVLLLDVAVLSARLLLLYELFYLLQVVGMQVHRLLQLLVLLL